MAPRAVGGVGGRCRAGAASAAPGAASVTSRVAPAADRGRAAACASRSSVRTMPSASGSAGAGDGTAGAAARRPARCPVPVAGQLELPGVPVVGGAVRALPRPGLHGIGGGIEDGVEVALLGVLEVAQDVLDGALRRRADADPQAGEVLRAHLADDRAQPVVAAGAAPLAEAQPPEGQGHVIDHDEQVRQGHALAGQHLAHGHAGEVHVGHGLDEDELVVAESAAHAGRGVPAT